MDGERASAADLAALRTALLEVHEEFLVPPPSRRTQRVLRQLQRLHLSWLLTPWFLVKVFGAFRFARRHVAVEARAVRLYGQLSGKDPHMAQAEVYRILGQLGSLDERQRPPDDESRPGAPGGTDPAEQATTTDALLGYYLAGRQTQDELLREVTAAWAEYEDLTQEQMQRGLERRGRDRRPEPEFELRAQAASDRYLVAWRRWLDSRAQLGVAGSPGEG